jgi:hypothetical protein
MKRLALTLAISLTAALCAPLAAQADFGLNNFEVTFTKADGSAENQAGSHPFAMETSFGINFHEEVGKPFVDGGDIKDLVIEQIRGFTGNTTAVPRCSTLDFATNEGGHPACGNEAAVGIVAATLQKSTEAFPGAVYNLTPPPGVPVRLGFVVHEVPVVLDVTVKPEADYNAVARQNNVPQPLTVLGAALQLWGTPADPAHDFARGSCAAGALPFIDENIVGGKLNLRHSEVDPALNFFGQSCSAGLPEEVPFIVLPRSCAGPLATNYELDPWNAAGSWVRGSVAMAPFEGCSELPFLPDISSKATADSAETSTGLDFELNFEDPIDHSGEGLLEPDGIAQSDLKRTVVTLPEGVTVNPSIGEGLGVCTLADLGRETLQANPGEGCPNASKIGTVRVDTPLVGEAVEGDVFLAQEDDPERAGKENPFDSLIAFYIVLKNQNLGILVKVPAEVEPDPKTGRLVTTVDDVPGFPVPEFPFTRFNFHFREGQRAPLVTPPACGTYTTVAQITPRARPNEVVTKTAEFQVTRGIGGGSCPPGGVPPFDPGFEAGSVNSNAASYSPFLMRLIRSDGEQDLTKFSATLPPGVLGKLVGVGKCSEAQIARAKAKSGLAELAAPSCPASSLIGHTLAGAGVGGALTFVPGQIYLAGPFKGDPLSVVAVTPAVAGPFDAGTVVVRIALTLNPKTGEVQTDGAASDPIPHILKGIPLKVREIRVNVDRNEFTLNPTSCDEAQTRATLFGGYLDVFSAADDVPIQKQARYQAANCSRLGFKPKLSLRLKGGTKRGGHPSLRALYQPRPGDANVKGLVVRLPRSAFLDQGHIRTICTRVQFAADNCPKAAIYGHARAFTPLLDEPLEGPVYLRSSSHKLPDLVFDLHGIVDIEASARIDSVHGGIRTTFTDVPDAPVSKVVLNMQGGNKGLIVNSRNLCNHKSKVAADLEAHSGKRAELKPALRSRCGKGRGPKRR